jgi:hypothetical protein
VAGEVLNFVSGGGTETRAYNTNGQLTTLRGGPTIQSQEQAEFWQLAAEQRASSPI